MGKRNKDKRRKAKKKQQEKMEQEQQKTYEEKVQDILASKKYKEVVNYLTQWESSRDQWKFHKLTQGWILENMYNPDIITPHYFKILLKYLKEAKGKTRDRLKEEAVGIIEKPEKVELTGFQKKLKDKDAIAKAKERKLKRAGKIADLFAE